MMRTRECFVLLAAVLCLAATAATQVTFTSAQYGPLSQSPQGIASGDFNRDGMPDLAVGLSSSGTATPGVGVFLATAPGQYGEHTDYPISSPSNQVVVGDFNGDGILDILAGDGPLTPLLGNGDGTFRTGTDIVVFGRVLAITAGDFNGDGAIDLAIVQQGPSSSGASLHIFLNHGDGTFTDTGALTSVDTTLAGIVAADFNGDGQLDLATEASEPARGLVFFGDGVGNFSRPMMLPIPNDVPAGDAETVGGVVTADLTGDAVPDLVFLAGYFCPPSACGNDRFTTFVNDGSGNFTLQQQLTLFGDGTGGSLLASDLDGDLIQDLMYWNPALRNGFITYWHGSGDGTFSQMNSNFSSSTVHQAIARDLNLDSRHDIALTFGFTQSLIVLTNNTGAANCAPPGSDTLRAKLCTPSDPNQVSGSITFSGSGNSPAGIQRLELWIDGTKKYQTLNDQLLHSEMLSAGSHLVELVAVDKYTGFTKTSMNLNVGSSGGGSCTAAQGTVNLCLPANNSTISSPVEFAGAENMPDFAWLRLYVDDQIAWEGPNQTFGTSIPLSAGNHHAVLVGYSSNGAVDDQTSQKFFTVGMSGGGTCAMSTVDQSINICLPTGDSAVSSPVQVTAQARWDGDIVAYMRVYIDDQPAFDLPNPQNGFLSTTIAIGSGTHTMVIVAWDDVGNAITSAPRPFAVQ